jgi:hypothetical protein
MQIALAGTGVHVYVLDTGILSGHTQFRQLNGSGQPTQDLHFPGSSRVSPTGFSGFRDNSWEDCNGHGTHVAAIIGGICLENHCIAVSRTRKEAIWATTNAGDKTMHLSPNDRWRAYPFIWLCTNAGEQFGVAKNVSLHSVRVLDCNSRTLASIIKQVRCSLLPCKCPWMNASLNGKVLGKVIWCFFLLSVSLWVQYLWLPDIYFLLPVGACLGVWKCRIPRSCAHV